MAKAAWHSRQWRGSMPGLHGNFLKGTGLGSRVEDWWALRCVQGIFAWGLTVCGSGSGSAAQEHHQLEHVALFSATIDDSLPSPSPALQPLLQLLRFAARGPDRLHIDHGEASTALS